jgi:hypothetical protein
MCLASFVLALGLAAPGNVFAEATQFDFAGDLVATFGPGTLDYFGASSGAVTFGTASSFGLPALPGGNASVMQFPAFTPSQGLAFDPASAASGGGNMVNQYTMIWDLLVPNVAASGYTCLYQADGTNGSDGELFINGSGGIGVHGNYTGAVTSNQWHRIAVVVDLVTQTMARYIDGVPVDAMGLESAVDGRHAVGASPKTLLLTDDDNETNAGYISCFYFTDSLLSDAEIAAFGGPTADGVIAADMKAKNPAPADGTDDVLIDTVLAWTPSKTTVQRDVYLGTTFADVNDASQANPGDVLVSQGQTATTYEPATPLEYGRTYYWRIDEVNGAPDNTVFKGKTWSFTTEPYAYPITDLTVAASAEQPTSPAINTINGSGLDAMDQHDTNLNQMWASPAGLPAWIQFTFDKEYKLHELWVWNSNSNLETFMGFGAKDVVVEYSSDGETWTALENVPQFAQGTGKSTYTANTVVDLGEVMARHVRLTITAAWGATGMVSLSEVRFFYTPAQAFEPDPADGATGIALDATLTWRPGREATSHQVCFGSDPNALAAETVTDHSYTPDSMDFGTTYYWRVDEVGDSGTFAGNLCSFTTQEFAVAEDFESYNDDIDAETTIWQAWIDGVTTKASGSTVGYADSPFAEQAIVHGGKQSMPFAYDNATQFYFSEAERTFDPVQKWTSNGASEFSLWVRGNPAKFVETAPGQYTISSNSADIWGTSDNFRFVYKRLSGNGSITAKVLGITGGSATWAKAGVMIRGSLDPASSYALMHPTPDGRRSFQNRPTDGASAVSAHSNTGVITLPLWVKVERQGNQIAAYYSLDGTTWTKQPDTENTGTDKSPNPQTISMTDPVYIGLAVAGNNSAAGYCFGEFSDVVTAGNVAGDWTVANIGVNPGNDAATMYVTVEDSAGKTGTASNADIVTSADWTRWAIPMSDFANVNFNKIEKMTITIGDKNAATAGGVGMVFIDDIGYGRSAQ